MLSGRAVDCVVGAGQVDFAGLYRALAWIAVTLGATALCQWALTAVTNRLAFGAALELRRRAFDHLQELPLSYLDSHGHGDLAARIVTDADLLTSGLIMAFQQLPVGVLTIVVTLVFMFALNPAIAAVVALLTPVSIFTARFIATHSARHFSGQTRLRGELGAYVEEMIGGISAIETFDRAEAGPRALCADERGPGPGELQGGVLLVAGEPHHALCERPRVRGDRASLARSWP